MAKGVEEKKGSKEMEKLVKAYIDAKEKNEGIETKYLNKLLKVLPAEKVARYYVAEEKFRHQQIGRLGNGNFPNLRAANRCGNSSATGRARGRRKRTISPSRR